MMRVMRVVRMMIEGDEGDEGDVMKFMFYSETLLRQTLLT